MTKTLTEQWKNGKIKEGFYYVHFCTGEIVYRHLSGNKPDKEFIELGCFQEILASVPSYDEYKQLISKTDQLEKRLEVSEKEHYRTLEQLRIATGALREYANCKPTEWMSCVTADKALKEMEGVK